jgi:hypothetical protein
MQLNLVLTSGRRLNILSQYVCAPVSADSVSAVSIICGLLQPDKNLKFKEINGS